MLNATISEKAAALVSTLDRKFASRTELEGLKTFVEKKLNENLQEIIAAKQAPRFASRGRWPVRSSVTGEIHDMETSLGGVLFTYMHLKKTGSLPRDRKFAREIEFVERAISDGSAGNGGTLIPQEWADFVIPELGAKIVFLKAGPNVLPMQHQVMNVPGLTNNATYTWQGENAAITESSPSTNNVSLTLRTLKGLTGISIEWMRDATPETDAALQANLVRGASRAADAGYFNGTGTLQPTGLLNVGSIGTSVAGNGATNGSTPTLDDISTMIYGLDAANAPQENRAFFCHPRTVDRLRKIKDTLGNPILWANPANALEMKLNGYPIYTTTAFSLTQSQGSANTCTTLLLVALSDVYVGQGIKSQGLEVAISEEALFANAEIAVRLLYRTDIVPGHPQSIYALTGVL